MNTGQIILGVALAVWGTVLYGFARWEMGDDKHLVRSVTWVWKMQPSRMQKRLLRKVTKEEWFEHRIGVQKVIFKWVFRPFLMVWLVGCITVTIFGLFGQPK